MKIAFNPRSIDSYRQFLAVKQLPRQRIRGRVAEFPDEYARQLGLTAHVAATSEYEPIGGLFDYQRDIAALAIRKRKFAVFADCGLGKTLILLEYARHCANVLPKDKRVLIISPLMVAHQTIAESERFYGDKLPMQRVAAANLQDWLNGRGERIGVTNYDALTQELTPGRLGALIADESSMLKSHYGKWGQCIIDLGRGLDWKLALTGTPAPNDRIEYANHAVFLDQFPTINAFLAKYFINRGQTQNRWEVKPHALAPFHHSLAHWSIFLTNPGAYGWRDNAGELPPINVHIHHVDLTDAQRELTSETTGKLFATDLGGIVSRASLGAIAKGSYRGEEIDTKKPAFIRGLVEQAGKASGLIWCLFNAEQDRLAREFPDAANIDGRTPVDERIELIEQFKRGERKWLISKAKVLGFGLNLQVATKQIFSGINDSFESFYQAVKRSNRYGSTKPLDVHIPVTELEEPMVSNVLRKASRVQLDAAEQERMFADAYRT